MTQPTDQQTADVRDALAVFEAGFVTQDEDAFLAMLRHTDAASLMMEVAALGPVVGIRACELAGPRPGPAAIAQAIRDHRAALNTLTEDEIVAHFSDEEDPPC